MWIWTCFAFSAFVLLLSARWVSYHGKGTVGRGPWDGGHSSQKAEAVSALLPLWDQLHYAYLVKGGRLLFYSTRPSTHPFDRLHRTAPFNSTSFYNTLQGSRPVDSFPPFIPNSPPNPFHSTDLHLLAELTRHHQLRRHHQLIDTQQPTLLYPPTPSNPLETGLSLV